MPGASQVAGEEEFEAEGGQGGQDRLSEGRTAGRMQPPDRRDGFVVVLRGSARRQRTRRRNPLEAGRVAATISGVDPTRYQPIGLIEPLSTKPRAWSGEGS